MRFSQDAGPASCSVFGVSAAGLRVVCQWGGQRTESSRRIGVEMGGQAEQQAHDGSVDQDCGRAWETAWERELECLMENDSVVVARFPAGRESRCDNSGNDGVVVRRRRILQESRR